MGSANRLPVGERVRIECRIPRVGRKFGAEGRIRWCREEGTDRGRKRYLMGVAFQKLSAGSLATIQALERSARLEGLA